MVRGGKLLAVQINGDVISRDRQPLICIIAFSGNFDRVCKYNYIAILGIFECCREFRRRSNRINRALIILVSLLSLSTVS